MTQGTSDEVMMQGTSDESCSESDTIYREQWTYDSSLKEKRQIQCQGKERKMEMEKEKGKGRACRKNQAAV
ncbi:unnamed protein product [Arctogadus glacialis]